MNTRIDSSRNIPRSSRLRPALWAVAFAATLFACGGESPSSSDSSLDTPATRIRTVASYQLVFDLMERKAHDDMAELMGGETAISGPIGPAQSHYVMLTLMNTAERGKTITDANVSMAIKGPGSSSANGGHVLSGKGMHHHALGFAGGEAGQYTVTATIERGEDRLSQSVVFDLPLPTGHASDGHEH